MPTPGRCGCWNWPSTASPPTPSSPTSAPASAPARPCAAPGPLSRRCLPSIARSRAGRLLPGEPGLRRAGGLRALEREQARVRQQGRPAQGAAQRLRRARVACDPAIALADDVRLLGDWLRYDVLALAGPCHADRLVLYDFILAELQARVPACAHRLGPIYRLLKNRRDDLLAFARRWTRSWGRWRWRGGWRPMACVAC